MTTSASRTLWTLVATLCVLLTASTAFANDSYVRVVRLSYLDGEVQMDRGDGEGFEDAFLNMPVAHGNRIWAQDRGRVEIELEDGSAIRLTPDTKLVAQQLSLRNNGDKISVFELVDGLAYFHIREKRDAEFRLVVGDREFEIRKSSRFRADLRGDNLELSVFKGEVVARSGGALVQVRSGETFITDLDDSDASRYFLKREVLALDFDQWDLEREDYRDAYSGPRYRETYVTNVYYGYSDLNYYGDYYVVAGYGRVWRPRGFAIGWNPFSHGGWVWYPGFGYVWVSSYAWGWTPFRYGGWVWLTDYGWCWQPSNSWHSWYSVPVIHRRPRGWVWTAPPRHWTRGGARVIKVGSGPARRWHESESRDVNVRRTGIRPEGKWRPFEGDRVTDNSKKGNGWSGRTSSNSGSGSDSARSWDRTRGDNGSDAGWRRRDSGSESAGSGSETVRPRTWERDPKPGKGSDVAGSNSGSGNDAGWRRRESENSNSKNGGSDGSSGWVRNEDRGDTNDASRGRSWDDRSGKRDDSTQVSGGSGDNKGGTPTRTFEPGARNDDAPAKGSDWQRGPRSTPGSSGSSDSAASGSGWSSGPSNAGSGASGGSAGGDSGSSNSGGWSSQPSSPPARSSDAPSGSGDSGGSWGSRSDSGSNSSGSAGGSSSGGPSASGSSSGGSRDSGGSTWSGGRSSGSSGGSSSGGSWGGSRSSGSSSGGGRSSGGSRDSGGSRRPR